MSDYHPLQQLYADPAGSFLIFEAESKRLQRNVILKRCAVSTALQIDKFVKSAIKKLLTDEYAAPLIDVTVTAEAEADKYRLDFVWEKQGEELDRHTYAPAIHVLSGFEGYRKTSKGSMNPNTGARVQKALSEHSAQEVILKSFQFLRLVDINPALKEAFDQAKVHGSPHICSLLDVCVFPCKGSFTRVSIVMEKLCTDLHADMALRLATGQRYTEAELTNILTQVAAGLSFAQSKVTDMAAHCTPRRQAVQHYGGERWTVQTGGLREHLGEADVLADEGGGRHTCVHESRSGAYTAQPGNPV